MRSLKTNGFDKLVSLIVAKPGKTGDRLHFGTLRTRQCRVRTCILSKSPIAQIRLNIR
ncbi:hypothetical protein [Microcoleus sp. S13C4]|uniref:hypothetical protein n=1 Tax=Microcoleus sp. S13C4 TaxID=3055410 RepID=UPI002FD3604D